MGCMLKDVHARGSVNISFELMWPLTYYFTVFLAGQGGTPLHFVALVDGVMEEVRGKTDFEIGSVIPCRL